MSNIDCVSGWESLQAADQWRHINIPKEYLYYLFHASKQTVTYRILVSWDRHLWPDLLKVTLWSPYNYLINCSTLLSSVPIIPITALLVQSSAANFTKDCYVLYFMSRAQQRYCIQINKYSISSCIKLFFTLKVCSPDRLYPKKGGNIQDNSKYLLR